MGIETETIVYSHIKINDEVVATPPKIVVQYRLLWQLYRLQGRARVEV